MPIKKQTFTRVVEDLQKAVDVDDSRGRSCPINMNFIEEGYLSKDTGCSIFGDVQSSRMSNVFHYKKKSGTSYIIGVSGNVLKKYNTTTSVWDDISTIGTCTMTIATPCVVTKTGHGLVAGSRVSFSTTGALPTGITAGTGYYVLASGLTADDFQISATSGGTAIDTSGTQSGTHTLSRYYTTDSNFRYIVYDDNLYGGNAYENYFKWDGTTFTEYASAPKGNILEIFEDRMFVSGVIAEPLSIYYSDVGAPTTFGGTSVLKPIGTDSVTAMENYYGQLLIFKQESIWKLTFVYDSITSLYIPKLEVQSGNYGACSRRSVSWVENDLWFFTGREIRSIGYKDQQIGILGINQSVISDQIKETLYTIDKTLYPKISTFYNNRRFYLSVPLDSQENDTIFVCHLLYGTNWTKYSSRIKASAYDFMSIDNVVYSSKSIAPYGVLKWDDALLNDNGVAISSSVFFRKEEDKDFNRFITYRYLDLMFKNLNGKMTVTLQYDAYDLRSSKAKTFYIGQGLEDMNATMGEVPFGQKLYGDGFGEDVTASPFEKKRVSFLIKAQTVTIGLSNNSVSETFTVCQYALQGWSEVRKLFKPAGIVSIK